MTYNDWLPECMISRSQGRPHLYNRIVALSYLDNNDSSEKNYSLETIRY